MVEQVKKLASELNAVSFANRRGLGDRKVGVELSRTEHGANPGIANSQIGVNEKIP